MPRPVGKPINQARRLALGARWGEIIQTWPPRLRGKANQLRVTIRNAELDTDYLEDLLALHGATIEDLDRSGIG